MESSADLNDDAYVADLLAKDARDTSIRYSSLGLQALLPKRPTNKAPKPNTRFLKNIIRQTDSHNAALKKNEELEARMRAQGVPLSESRVAINGHDRRGDRSRIEGASDSGGAVDRHKRKRYSDSHPRRDTGRHEHERRSKQLHHSHHDASDTESNNDRRSRQRGRRDTKNQKYSWQSSCSSSPMRSNRRHKRFRRRSYSYNSDEDRRHRRKRGRSPSKSRFSPSQSPQTLDDATTPPHRRRPPRPSDRLSDSPARSSSSDPLESFVGPLPASTPSQKRADPSPLTSRGRGANRPTSSTIDSHFSSSYNPSIDLHHDSEMEDQREDWDMALEALRDRKLWQQKGAERLRAAGFGDEEVQKWEDNGREKGAEDVKWAIRGESREWDRGKVVEQDGERKGEVSLEAAWKRKGGGFMRGFREALG